MLKEKDLIPVCARGQEIKERFDEFHFRKNPQESPMAKALVAHGYEVTNYPLQAEYTDEDWLGSKVNMKGLTIIFRQPTPIDLLVCRIERESKERKIPQMFHGDSSRGATDSGLGSRKPQQKQREISGLNSRLLGFMEFSAFCHYHCPEIQWLGGCVEKVLDRGSPEDLKLDRLVRYYNRILGNVEGYSKGDGYFWIYADMHYKERFNTLPIWKRYRRENFGKI